MAKLPYRFLRFLRPTEQEAAACLAIVQGTTGIVARHINKRVSLPLSLLLSRRGIKPNHITFFNMGVGLLSGSLAGLGSQSAILWGACLFQIASILDGVDGEVAKLSKRTSQFGQWLDTISDNLTLAAFLIGLTTGLYQRTMNSLLFWAGEMALFSFLVLIAIMLIFLKKNTDSGSFVTYDKEFVSKIAEEESGFLSKFVKYGRYLLKKDSFAMLFFLLALVRFPEGIVYITAIGTTVGWLLIAYFNIKRKLAKPVLAPLELAEGEDGN